MNEVVFEIDVIIRAIVLIYTLFFGNLRHAF